MSKRLPIRPGTKPPLRVEKILSWADEFRRQHGRFPTQHDGIVPGELTQTWGAVDNALRQGRRGLPPGNSLARLLAERRGHRHRLLTLRLTVNQILRYRLLTLRLTVNQILRWADAHRRRTGEWPHRHSGPVADAPGETWAAIDGALHVGGRGLRGGMSLAGILAKRRGRLRQVDRPLLTVELILVWAEAHHTLFGAWPSKGTGAIGTTGETWLGVDSALRVGLRGLPGGSSLSRLLQEHGKFQSVRGNLSPYMS